MCFVLKNKYETYIGDDKCYNGSDDLDDKKGIEYKKMDDKYKKK